MRHQLILQDSIMVGAVDVDVLSDAMAEREPWGQPLSGVGMKLYTRLLASLERRDEGVLQRLRRRPDAAASLLAFLPAPSMLELFGAIERADERMLSEVETSLPESTLVGRLARARVGFLRAVSAMSRVMGRTRLATQVSAPRM